VAKRQPHAGRPTKRLERKLSRSSGAAGRAWWSGREGAAHASSNTRAPRRIEHHLMSSEPPAGDHLRRRAQSSGRRLSCQQEGGGGGACSCRPSATPQAGASESLAGRRPASIQLAGVVVGGLAAAQAPFVFAPATCRRPARTHQDGRKLSGRSKSDERVRRALLTIAAALCCAGFDIWTRPFTPSVLSRPI
jgi:hypothetical protein